MSIRMKLASLVSAFVLMIGVLVIGVFALNQKIILSGSVSFNVVDRSLWIKDVRISNDNYAEEPINEFLPGYINNNFNLAISTETNTYGSFALHFDIINTTTSAYVVAVDYSGLSSISGLTVTVSPAVIPANDIQITEITSSTPITTTLDIVVSNPHTIPIDLNQIIIIIDEAPQTYSDFIFTTSGTTATLISYTGDGGDIVIPSTISLSSDGSAIEGIDYTVTSIADGTNGNSVFYSARSNITSIELPNTITKIGDYAFYGCDKLTAITIPESVITIGSHAFGNCTAVTEINFNAISSDDLNVNSYAFDNAGDNGDGLVLNIGAQVTKIPAYLFYPSGGWYGGVYYTGSANIRQINVAENNNLTSVGEYAFSYCERLETVNFGNCAKLATIEHSAFAYCSALSSVTIPDNIESIESAVFDACYNLIYSAINNGVNYIGNETNPYLVLINDDGFTGNTYQIADGCKIVYGNAFLYNTNITSVTMPNSITSIGSASFNCNNLETIILYATIPPILEDDLLGAPATTIYVPAESVDAYKSASGWSSYADIITAIA